MEINFTIVRHQRLTFCENDKVSIRTVLKSKVKDKYLCLSILTTREDPNDSKIILHSFLEMSDNEEAINVHVYPISEGSLTILGDHILAHEAIKEIVINQIKSLVCEINE